MSMIDYAEYGIGFVLTDNDKINGKDAISYLVEKSGFEDVYELIESKEDDSHVWRFYDDEMGGKNFYPFLSNNSEEPREMLVIFAKNPLKPSTPAYPGGPDEIRAEFKDLLGNYLPNNFDYDAHIGEFNTTICC